MDDSAEGSWRESLKSDQRLSVDSLIKQCCHLADDQHLYLHDRLRQLEIMELILLNRRDEADISRSMARHKLINVSVSLMKYALGKHEELHQTLAISTLDFSTLRWDMIERWFNTLYFEPSILRDLVVSETFSTLVPWPKDVDYCYSERPWLLQCAFCFLTYPDSNHHRFHCQFSFGKESWIR